MPNTDSLCYPSVLRFGPLHHERIRFRVRQQQLFMMMIVAGVFIVLKDFRRIV
jgi:hypothetical protein